MATKKTENLAVAYIHAFFYSALFILLVPDGGAWLIIFSTHVVIDRYRLAKWWIRLVNWKWTGDDGYPDGTPKWLTVWLLIIIDNVWHIVINTVVIVAYYHYYYEHISV